MWIGNKKSGEYLALSLVRLFEQINAAAPHRKTSDDGSIGDTSHQAGKSEHNPNPDLGGVVLAMDLTHDPSGGFDSYAFAEHLRTVGADPRVQYVISNGRIWNKDIQGSAWRPYNGKNKHDHHVHITAVDDPRRFDNQGEWNVVFKPLPDTPPTPQRDPVLRKGQRSEDVRRLQTMLGFPEKDRDGRFGLVTEAAVLKLQKASGLTEDGVVGQATWATAKEAAKTRGPDTPAPAGSTPAPAPAPERRILFAVEGKMSVFGGPKDTGVKPDEGLGLFASEEAMRQHGLESFLMSPTSAGVGGLARRLVPSRHYIACRWNTAHYPILRNAVAHVTAKGKTIDDVRPMDWGPHERTGRIADLSPGLARDLGLETDDVCSVVVYEDGK